jgi:hypothetical protein
MKLTPCLCEEVSTAFFAVETDEAISHFRLN